MTDYDHGPLRTYEITWSSGHVERIDAHQVTWPHNPFELIGPATTKTRDPGRVMLHGQVDGKWQLLLAAHPEDIRTIRNLAHDEHIVPPA